MTGDPEPFLVETRSQRWNWIIHGVSGAAWLVVGLSVRASEPTWYVVTMSVLGVVMLVGSIVEFQAHRRRLRDGA